MSRVLLLAILISACGPLDHRSRAEKRLAEKEACEKLGHKFIYDGARWKCGGL